MLGRDTTNTGDWVEDRKNIKNVLDCPQTDLFEGQLKSVITIDNLHGNAAKLLHMLVLADAIYIEKKHYDLLIKIYEKSNQSYSNKDEEVFQFMKTLDQIVIGNKFTKIRILGKDLASSGKNDILTLLIYNKLIDLEIEFEVIVSRQSMEFLGLYAHGIENELIINLDKKPASSLASLKNDIDNKIWSGEDLNDLNDIISSYLAHKKLLSYLVFSDEEMIIFSNAPINAIRIGLLAKTFNIEPNVSNVNGLVKTIDKINNAFRLILSDKSSLESFMSNYLEKTDLIKFISGGVEVLDEDKDVHRYIVWNVYGGEEQTLKTDEEALWLYKNITSEVGKPEVNTGNCGIIVSTESQFSCKNVKHFDREFEEDICFDEPRFFSNDNDEYNEPSEQDYSESSEQDDSESSEQDENATNNLKCVLRSNANLNQYPEKRYKHSDGEVVTIGDLHGNAIKFIYSMIIENIIHISENDYYQLLQIYSKSDQLYQDKFLDFTTFMNIMLAATPISPRPKFQLIGDDLADRGKNDYLTLFVYTVLKKMHVEFEVIASNHAMEFIRQYAYGFENDSEVIFAKKEYFCSLIGMTADIKKKFFTEETISDLIENSYLPYMKLLSYSVLGNTITYFSHAPINRQRIRSLALQMNIEPMTNTIENLVKTIDAMNKKFSELLINKESLISFFENEYQKKGGMMSFLWSREEVGVEEDDEPVNFLEINIHGHLGDGHIKNSKVKNGCFYVNLDSPLGRPGVDEESYYVLISNENPIVENIPIVEKTPVIEITNKDATYKYFEYLHKNFTDPNHDHPANELFLIEIIGIINQEHNSLIKMEMIIERLECEIDKEKLNFYKENSYSPTFYSTASFDIAISDPNISCTNLKRARMFYELLVVLKTDYGYLYAEIGNSQDYI